MASDLLDRDALCFGQRSVVSQQIRIHYVYVGGLQRDTVRRYREWAKRPSLLRGLKRRRRPIRAPGDERTGAAVGRRVQGKHFREHVLRFEQLRYLSFFKFAVEFY